MVPTKTVDRFFLFAESPNKNTGDIYGKWIISVGKDVVDEWWPLVKDRTENGLLGYTAECTTYLHYYTKDQQWYNISIYTEESNIIDVRERLLDIGVKWRIPYKTEEATKSRKYTRNGHIVTKCWA